MHLDSECTSKHADSTEFDKREKNPQVTCLENASVEELG